MRRKLHMLSDIPFLAVLHNARNVRMAVCNLHLGAVFTFKNLCYDKQVLHIFDQMTRAEILLQKLFCTVDIRLCDRFEHFQLLIRISADQSKDTRDINAVQAA